MSPHPFPRFAILTVSSVLLFATSCRCPAPEGGGAPGVVYASISVRCGSDVYTISTGTNGGKCQTTEGPAASGAQCTHGGNGATMTCTGGVGKCIETEGSGSCGIKAD